MKIKKQTKLVSKKTMSSSSEEIKKRLSLLEDYVDVIVPSLKEILDEETKLFDKVWYTRHLCSKNKPNWNKNTEEIKRGALKFADKLIKKYGKEWLLDYKNDFEWGMILGKLEMISWVISGKHDDLDT